MFSIICVGGLGTHSSNPPFIMGRFEFLKFSLLSLSKVIFAFVCGVFCPFIQFVLVFLDSQQELSLAKSNQQMCGFYNWVIFEQ